MSAARYAVYFAPDPAGALAAAGRSWLGRDAETGVFLMPPAGLGPGAAAWPALTAEPRRYGFHATLKPPFRLAEGRTADGLHAAVAALAAATPRFDLPGLQVAALDGFLALTETAPCAALDALAGACVADLDGFRAPPTEAELARRRKAALEPRHEAHLARWGYPYVFDCFRFHMTLTGRIGDERRREALRRHLADHFAAALADPVAVDALCLFVEPEPGAPMVVAARLPLGPAGP